jgi:hypothetical protein
MTYPSKAQSPAILAAAPLLRKRGRRLLLVFVTSLSAVTLSGVSLAASSPSEKAHQASSASPRQAPVQRSKARPRTSSPESKPQALHKTHRKAPIHARLAAKSKPSKPIHKARSKPAKSVARNPKPVA